MDDAAAPLMQVANEAEADAVCEELRAAGIKCNYARVADPNAPLAFLHAYGQPDTVLAVFVLESELDRARATVSEHEAESRAPID
jgi:hypothetical protein